MRMFKILLRLLRPRYRFNMAVYRIGYADGYEAALDTIDAVEHPYEAGYALGHCHGHETGYLEGKEAGIRTRAHYTRLMISEEE